MRIDMSADHLCWDNTEAVTVEVPARKSPRAFAVAVAKGRAVRGRERSPSGGVYLGFEKRWLLPARLVPAGESIAPACVVVDEEQTRWTVLTAEQNKAKQTWALGCVNLTLALDLRETVLIERATISYDAAGAAVKDSWRTLYAAQARVQETERESNEALGVRSQRERYEVTVDRQMPDVDVAEDRIKWVDRGVTRCLDIVAYRRPERIDELPVLEVEERA